jgi:PIN domain nuclease of toxin-antitoxin system
MNVLLDTHVVLWAFTEDPRLSGRARDAIVDGGNLVFVSAASAWEISIKKAIGKLQAPNDFLEEVHLHRFTTLDITCEHALRVEQLPLVHADPFDRLLVAQSIHERLTLVTHDHRLEEYGGPILLI